MKTSKKTVSLAMGLALLCGSAFQMVGCGGRSEFEEPVDKSKTQLIVGNYEGGFGSEWLEDIKTKFEAANAGVSYETGKKGVQILINPNKTEGDSYDFSKTSDHVAFTEKMTSTYLLSLAAQGKLTKLDDVMTAILAQENVSLDEDVLNAIKVYDGSVYYIPHYEGGGGFVYDKDLFDEYSFYISATGGWTNASGSLSVGADGEAGTLDDGLPATYKEFFALCARMKQNTVTPFIISGEWKNSYQTFILDRAATAYDGIQTTKAFLEFDGTEGQYVTNITPSETAYFGYTVTTKKEAITEANAYYNNQRAGRLYALELLQEMIEKDYFDVAGWASTISHLDAQDMYLRSYKNNEPIAMLVDGTWWENEATPVFESMGSTNANHKKENRNFGWMAFPTKVDENDTNASKDSMATLNHLNANVIVRSGLSADLEKLAKDFIKFCYTEENLEAFTVKTGTTRVFDYKLSDKAYNSLTSYQKDIWKMHENGMFILEDSDSEFYMNNKMEVFKQVWSSKEYTLPLQKFSENGNKVTAEQFFKSYWVTADEWQESLAK